MDCPNCGRQPVAGDKFCRTCGEFLVIPPQAQSRPRDNGRSLAIQSIWLAAAGLVTCGITAVIGLGYAVASVWQAARGPKYRGRLRLPIIGTMSCLFMIYFLTVQVAPIFLNANEAARKAYCLNCLKQYSQALRLYCDDYQGTLPSSILNTKTNSRVDFACKLSVDGNYPPVKGAKYTMSQMLCDYLKVPDRAMCPRDPAYSQWPQAQNNPIASYWYKMAMDLAWTSPAVARRKIDDYGYPDQQIVFFEHSGWHVPITLFNRTGWSPDAEKGVRRGMVVNAAFMDTHVETMRVPEQGLPESWPPVQPKDSMLPYEPFFYNNHVDKQGKEHLQQAPLRPNTETGLCIDPSNNYDRLE